MSDFNKNNHNKTDEELVKDIQQSFVKLGIGKIITKEEMMNNPTYQKAQKRKEKAKKKEEKEWEKQLKDKPEFLMLLARFFYKVIHFLHFIYSLCGLSNLYFAWKIYKVCSVAGWLGIVQTKYTLYIVAYFAIWVIVDKLNFKLYLYGNDEF